MWLTERTINHFKILKSTVRFSTWPSSATYSHTPTVHVYFITVNPQMIFNPQTLSQSSSVYHRKSQLLFITKNPKSQLLFITENPQISSLIFNPQIQSSSSPKIPACSSPKMPKSATLSSLIFNPQTLHQSSSSPKIPA